MLAFLFHERPQEVAVKCKYEFRCFKIPNFLCAEVIPRARVSLSNYCRTVWEKKNLTYSTTHDNYTDSGYTC